MRHHLKFLLIIIGTLFHLTAYAQKTSTIDSLESIKLGGIEQWISINSNNTQKPILLILHGGPGFAMMPLFHEFNSELENYFTVVNWDQRGAGLSYTTSLSKNTMTLKQFVADAHELTLYLKARFHQPKIYLLAHSFGTMIGIELIKQYPQDYYAYIGVGQVVSFARNEIGSYDYALNQALATKNAKAIQALRDIGRPDAQGHYQSDDGYDITEKWVAFFGGDLHQHSSDQLYDDIVYRGVYQDKKIEQQWQAGIHFSQALFDDPEVTEFDIEKSISAVEVPVYFLSGKYDYDTPVALVQEYYQRLKAPKKAFIEFENSAHFPFYEEPKQFNAVLIKKILPETQANN